MLRRWLVRVAVAVPLGLLLILVAWLGVSSAIYSPEYVWRVLAWQQSDIGDYLNNFPHRQLTAAQTPYKFESAPADDRVTAAFQGALGVDDLTKFLNGNGTQAFIVIQNDRVIYEKYYNGYQRDSMVTSFSVAKSFASTLVGIAIEEGRIRSLDDPITTYLPELRARDARFDSITIRNVLNMASGLDYQEARWFLFNGDDPLTTYYPDQRAISLSNTHIVDPPGQRFLYNKYHPQLLGMILERTTGMSVTAWTQTRLWDPLGMEFDGAWSLDSTASGFEKMEAGVNARAIDFAKLGRLFLNRGMWNGKQIVSPGRVDLATGVDPKGRAPAFDKTLFYGLMWWGVARPDGASDFFAAGDHGQYIFVSPSNRVVVVRTGTEYGIPTDKWAGGFSRAADTLGES